MTKPHRPVDDLKEAGRSFGIAALVLLLGFGPPVLAITSLLLVADWKYVLGVPALLGLSLVLGRRRSPPRPDTPVPPTPLWQQILSQLPLLYALGVLLFHRAWVWTACVVAAFMLGTFGARVIARRELARMEREG